MEEIKIFLNSPIFWLFTGVTAIFFNIAFFLIAGRIESDRYIRIATLLATFCLVVVGIWYSYETRALKINAENQTKEFRNQFRLSSVPNLFLTLIPQRKVTELIKEGKITYKSGDVTYTKGQLAEVVKHYVLLENVSHQIAYDARLYLFRADIKTFMKPASFRIYVKPEKPEAIFFIDDSEYYIDEIKLIEEINDIYGLQLYSLKNYIKKQNANYLLLYYKDIQGYTYLRTRYFGYSKHNNLIQGKINFHEFNF